MVELCCEYLSDRCTVHLSGYGYQCRCNCKQSIYNERKVKLSKKLDERNCSLNFALNFGDSESTKKS